MGREKGEEKVNDREGVGKEGREGVREGGRE